jgi:hypothetical protein
MDTLEFIEKFDLFLIDLKLTVNAVVIGGAALNLLGVVSRYTRDCDILDPEIPTTVITASQNFAIELRRQGQNLRDDWLNNGPESLKKNLTNGWQKRLVELYKGKAMHFSTLGRSDLVKTKLFAFCDRGTDRQDYLMFKPNHTELIEALEWVKDQDANPDWPKYVSECFSALAKELGYEL